MHKLCPCRVASRPPRVVGMQVWGAICNAHTGADTWGALNCRLHMAVQAAQEGAEGGRSDGEACSLSWGFGSYEGTPGGFTFADDTEASWSLVFYVTSVVACCYVGAMSAFANALPPGSCPQACMHVCNGHALSESAC